MPRPRSVTDEALLDAALSIVHRDGPGALSFATLAGRVGLAASTIVQRFGTRADLLRAALVRAWDGLDEHTAAAIAAASPDAAGVVELFVELTGTYDDDDYADQLQVLREDLRDPVLRRRGERWIATLAAAVDERLPGAPPGTGQLVVAQWQGSLTVWGFTRPGPLQHTTRRALTDLLARLDPTAPRPSGRRNQRRKPTV